MPTPPPHVFLEELTSPELTERIRVGATTVLVPVGGTEQNGAVDPRLVRSERLQAPAPGVTGDPRRASAALGNAAVDAIVAQSVSAIRAAVAAH